MFFTIGSLILMKEIKSLILIILMRSQFGEHEWVLGEAFERHDSIAAFQSRIL